MPTLTNLEPRDSAEAYAPAALAVHPESPDKDACRQALSRVLKSKNFEKAARLSEVLEHVCNLTLEGRGSEISELRIGVVIFSRAENYNTSDDNIVRSTIRLLRQRLERYYAEEGADDPIRIEIPRGTYTPVFSSHSHLSAVNVEIEQPVSPPATPETSIGRKRLSFLWFSGAALLLLGALAISFEAGRILPTLHLFRVSRFWSVVFPKDRDTLLVPADTMLMMYERATHQIVPLDQYVAGNFGRPPAADADPEERGLLSGLRNKRYTAVTSVGIAASLGRNAAPGRAPKVRFSRDLHLDDLKQSNVILIGAEQNNPWVHLYRSRLNFHLDWVGDVNRFRVLNDHPNSGEPAEWNWSKEDATHRGYGQIAFLPNLGGQGYALIIAGTSMDGTQAASEFLMDPRQMDPVLRQAGERGNLLGGFEVLLLAKVLDHGTLASTILGTRFYPPQ